MNNEPVAYRWKWDAGLEWHYADYYTDRDYFKLEPLYTHPVKKLHLSLQKDKETGELLAVTYTDDEHRIVEVLWQKSPVKELDEDFDAICLENKRLQAEIEALKADNEQMCKALFKATRAILRKAQE